jgi:hypothetical protein
MTPGKSGVAVAFAKLVQRVFLIVMKRSVVSVTWLTKKLR